MKKLYDFYEERIAVFSDRLEKIKRKIHLIGSIRLAIVIAAGVSFWFLKDQGPWILVSTGITYLVPFVILMVIHNKLFRKKEYTETLIDFNRNERKGLDYDYGAFDGAPEMTDPGHMFGLDLDLFGNRSLFQAINRTVTETGKSVLAKWFIHPLASKQKILKRQEAVRELAGMPEMREHFYVTGYIRDKKKGNIRMLEQLVEAPALFNCPAIWRVVQYLLPAGWGVGTGLVAAGLIPGIVLSWFFLFCIFLSYSQINKVNKLHNSVDKLEKILSTYVLLIRTIESRLFDSEELKSIATQLDDHGLKASETIRRLTKHLHALDQRYNWFFDLFLNAFYLWDIRQCVRIEQWKKTYAANVEEWFDALARFDALCSLGGFAYNHPEYVFPEIADSYFCMEGKALGHPLIPRDGCVRNNIDIEKSPSFLIITGANMAGKSTYLRTVGVNYLLSLTGAPVFAEQLRVYPARLVTSLRTADSLSDNESYFFAELKRLKMIIDRLSRGEELFIILDEILKGTNSIDKQKGSLALIKQLIAQNACGIIATHDLMLGSLEKEFPGEIKNFRFEADITNNELTFSYQLRHGIAQNMNACFLMKKMGITI